MYIFLCEGFLNSQNVDPFIKIDSLMADLNYYPAQLECEKLIFLSDDHFLTANALLKKSECYKQLEDFESAVRTLNRVNFINLPDSLHYYIRYQLALCSYLSKEFEFAEHQIELINNYIKDTNLINQSCLLQALIYNETNKWGKARQAAIKYINLCELGQAEKDSSIQSINIYYNNPPKIKSPDKAKKYSTFCPGLGQIYSGYAAEGIFNISLHLIAMGTAGVSFYYKHYLTGYFGGLALLQKFYYGGLNRVEHLANKYNYEHQREFNDSVKSILIKKE